MGAQADSYQERHGQQLDKSGGAAWGLWQVSEDALRVLGDVADKDVLEFSCGAPTVFQLPYGTWIRLFRENGLIVEDLIELRPAGRGPEQLPL